MQGIAFESSSESSNKTSMSTISKPKVAEHGYMGMPEVSSHPKGIRPVEEEDDGAELELGLGLGLGVSAKVKPCTWGDYCRILTAKDFPSHVSSPAPAVSSARASVAGTKRAADSVSVSQELCSDMPSNQVVGWPPIRAYRMNSLVNQTKGSAEQNIVGSTSANKSGMDIGDIDGNSRNNKVQEKQGQGHSKFVKVNMDGVPIGRKVDLNAHVCYETLARALEDMFHRPNCTNATAGPSGCAEHEVRGEASRLSKLLDGSSEFALTYEDREGDWMLVGDVPWGMFLSTARRLRIMRTSDASGLAPRTQERSSKQRSKAI